MSKAKTQAIRVLMPLDLHAAIKAEAAKDKQASMSSVMVGLADAHINGVAPVATPKAKTVFKISKEDRTVIEAAAKASGKSFDQFIGDVALKAAKKGTRAGGAADTIGKAIEKIIHHNTQAKKWFDRIEITQGVLAKKPTKENPWGCGSNLRIIREYLAANQATIDAHHKKAGIEAEHNRRASLERRKIARAAAAKKAKK